MEASLTRLGFSSIDEVTVPTLRAAFRQYAALTHPDKGGSEGDFEDVLGSYLHLSTILRRQTGGRDGQAVLHPKDVLDARHDQFVRELNNMVNEVYDGIDREQSNDFLKQFNEAFEKLNVTEANGYDEWFRKHDEMEVSEEKEPVIENFNEAFEETVRKGKPAPTTLALPLDEMAFFGGAGNGTSLFPSITPYYSAPGINPEYTDLYAAYTTENTVTDKLPVWNTVRTMDEIMKERDLVYDPLTNEEQEEIAMYEKRKQEQEKKHKEKIQAYFASTASSQWALDTKLVPS